MVLKGTYRFLSRVWRLFIGDDGSLNAKINDGEASDDFKRTWHKTIKKVTEDFEGLRFNTAISQLMIFVNEAYKTDVMPKAAAENFVQMLSPLAPHIAEELWERLGHTESITYAALANYDEAWTIESEVEIVVQVNGKIVERTKIAKDLDGAAMQEHSLSLPNVKAAVEGKTVRKVSCCTR